MANQLFVQGHGAGRPGSLEQHHALQPQEPPLVEPRSFRPLVSFAIPLPAFQLLHCTHCAVGKLRRASY